MHHQSSAERLKITGLKQCFPSYGLQSHGLQNHFKCIVGSTVSLMIRVHPQTFWVFGSDQKSFFNDGLKYSFA